MLVNIKQPAAASIHPDLAAHIAKALIERGVITVITQLGHGAPTMTVQFFAGSDPLDALHGELVLHGGFDLYCHGSALTAHPKKS